MAFAIEAAEAPVKITVPDMDADGVLTAVKVRIGVAKYCSCAEKYAAHDARFVAAARRIFSGGVRCETAECRTRVSTARPSGRLLFPRRAEERGATTTRRA